jgi:lipoprotein-anchoring transpeptidase ErfK/SrfK
MNRRKFFLSALALAAFPASAAAESVNARYNFQGRAWPAPGRSPQALGPSPQAWGQPQRAPQSWGGQPAPQAWGPPQQSAPQRSNTRSRQWQGHSSRNPSGASSYGGKQIVAYPTSEAPGTIIVNTGERRLYYVLGDGQAIQYGVGVGRQGFEWSGVAKVGAKREWPAWHPPQEMIERELIQYGRQLPARMEGGPGNPLGARALYLYENGRDTLYRIHGTNEPRSIGLATSSGCIRMLNEEAIDLYDRVSMGAKVIVI